MAFWLFSLAVFRFIGGVAVGAASVIAPTYIAQIAPARIRGRLGSLQQLAIVLGIFLALLADYAIATAAGGSKREWLLGLEAWRWMFLSMTVASVLYGVLALTIPESPRHLVAKGHLDEAREVLRRVLGNIDLDAKVIQIRDTLVHETRPGMRDLRGPALGLLPIVWVGHHAVGVSAVRRHQRDLLLLQRAVAGGRVQRGRRAAHHGDQHRGERPDHAGRHRRWSPSPRSTASAAVRCC